MPSGRRIVVLAVDGSQSLDVLGPVEVFDHASRHVPGAYRVEVVAPTDTGTITLTNGLRLGAAPLPVAPARLDTLLVAGGEGSRAAVGDPDLVAWIARAARRARRTASVCTGAYLLAAAGLLDGRRATTHWQFSDSLVAGQPDLALEARLGEVVRFYLTNTANTRVFKVALPDAPMKLVGGDSGRVEREGLVEELVLAPSERFVVDVLFGQRGEFRLEHRTPGRVYPLAGIRVTDTRAQPSLEEPFRVLRTNPEMVAERERIAPYLDAAPEKTLAFIAEMDMEGPEGDGPLVYTCPMHPQVVTNTPGHCPECGMKLLPSGFVAAAGAEHEHHDEAREHHGDRDHATADGIEWEDDMVEVNRLTIPANMRWKLIDRDSGAENTAIDWRFEAHENRGARRHPARSNEPRNMDVALPHRRASRERHDVHLQGGPAIGRQAIVATTPAARSRSGTVNVSACAP